MQFKAHVIVMPQREILDPQGKAVEGALIQLSGSNIGNVRVGKKIEFEISSPSIEDARLQVEDVSKKLLANLIIEDFHIELVNIED